MCFAHCQLTTVQTENQPCSWAKLYIVKRARQLQPSRILYFLTVAIDRHPPQNAACINSIVEQLSGIQQTHHHLAVTITNQREDKFQLWGKCSTNCFTDTTNS